MTERKAEQGDSLIAATKEIATLKAERDEAMAIIKRLSLRTGFAGQAVPDAEAFLERGKE